MGDGTVQYIVQIVESKTGKVVHESKPQGRWLADKTEDGMNINLNHEEYHTKIVEAER